MAGIVALQGGISCRLSTRRQGGGSSPSRLEIRWALSNSGSDVRPTGEPQRSSPRNGKTMTATYTFDVFSSLDGFGSHRGD
jgi:hypothetical protein